MRSFIVEPKSLREIPRELLAQKDSYDLDSLLALSESPQVMAWTLRDADGLVGFAILIFDGLYNSLCIDTLVIDRQRRSIPMLHDVAEHVVALAKALGAVLHAKRVITGMRGGKAMLRWFPEGHVVHTAIGFDLPVTGGAECRTGD